MVIMAMNVRAADPAGTNYFRFSVGRQGEITRHDSVVSIRAEFGRGLLSVLLGGNFLKSIYTRRVAPFVEEEDGMRPGKSGLKLIYEIISTNDCMNKIVSALPGLVRTCAEEGFIREHIIPLLPPKFDGAGYYYHTDGYQGDPGVGYADAQPGREFTALELNEKLRKSDPLSDITTRLNSVGLQASESVKAKLYTLLS
jgi:hypothetical protein